MSLESEVCDLIRQVTLYPVKSGEELFLPKILDSANYVELILSLEEHFDISIDTEQLTIENLKTPSAITNLVSHLK